MSENDLKVRVKSKKGALTLRWLQMAVDKSKNGRIQLSGIHVREDGVSEATDGFRLHRAPTPACLKEFEGQVVLVNGGKRLFKSAGRAYSIKIVRCSYPDTDQLFEGKLAMEPMVAAGVNLGYVADAMEMPVDIEVVLMKVLRKGGPTLFETVRGEGFKALVMPVLKMRHDAIRDARRRQRAVEHIKESNPEIWEAALEAVDAQRLLY